MRQALAFALLLVSLAQAQDQRPVWVTTQDEIELTELLDAYSIARELPLDYDRSKVAGKVTVRSGTGIPSAGLWTLINRQLAGRGLACIQAAGEEGLAIVAIEEAAKLARIEPGPAEDSVAGFVKVLLPVRPGKASAVVEILQQVLTAKGSLVQAVADADQVLLAGPAPQVTEAIEVAERVDVTDAEIVVEEFLLQHVAPTAVAKLLERIGQAMAKVRATPLRGTLLADALAGTVLVIAPVEELPYWRENLERFDRRQPAVTREYTPVRFGLAETAKLMEEVVRDAGWRETTESWRLVRDELTGTLILTATPHQHEEVEALLARLEATPADALVTMRSFPVRHRDVDQVLELLRELVGGGPIVGVPAEEEEPRSTEGGTGGPVAAQTGGTTLTKDPSTNRILAVGSPRAVEGIGELIASLDTRQPQVLVEAMIVSLTESESRQLAVQLQELGRWDGALLRASSLFGMSPPDASLATLPASSGTGAEAVLLDPGSFHGVLRALATLSEGRDLNIPKVLVANNETATLDSVLQTPFASTNASTTVATTSLGGTSDAGTQITVTPQITDGDQLLIDYQVSLSSFVGEASDVTLPPPRQQNSLTSVATVPDGFAVVVGGLEVEQETESASKVPLLGDLPILGALFRSTTRTMTKTRFFVFLRCSVLRDARFEDLRYLSRADLGVAGISSDAPAVEPRIIR